RRCLQCCHDFLLDWSDERVDASPEKSKTGRRPGRERGRPDSMMLGSSVRPTPTLRFRSGRYSRMAAWTGQRGGEAWGELTARSRPLSTTAREVEPRSEERRVG